MTREAQPSRVILTLREAKGKDPVRFRPRVILTLSDAKGKDPVRVGTTAKS
jgi:hypothetical protein